MKKYKQRFLWRNIFYSNFTIIFVLFLLFFLVSGLYKLYVKYEFTKADLDSVSKDRTEEQEKLSLTQNKLENINTEAGQEKYIRETYSVKKAGEEVIIVYNNPSSTYAIPRSDTFWETVKKFFTDLW
jgi:predicted membrane protein